MAQLTAEARKIISEFGPALIATANKEGKPNVSPKGSFRVLDDEHVAFANIASPRTIGNLKENPQLTAIIFDRSTRKGCRIWGDAEILDKGELFDAIAVEFAKQNMRVRHVVRVKVKEAEQSARRQERRDRQMAWDFIKTTTRKPVVRSNLLGIVREASWKAMRRE